MAFGDKTHRLPDAPSHDAQLSLQNFLADRGFAQAQSIRSAVVDMLGIAPGTRPLEQIGDYCPYGGGGALYQMSLDMRSLNVLGED